MEIPGGRKAMTAAIIAALGIGSGGLLLEYGYRRGELNREGIPRTRTDVDDAMDEVMARVARLELFETGGTAEGYYEMACGARTDFNQTLLQGAEQVRRIAMACPTKYGSGKVLEDGAWVEGGGSMLEPMSWQIQGGRGGTARAATMTATDGSFEVRTSPLVFSGDTGVEISCEYQGGEDFACSVARGTDKKKIALENSAGSRLLKWVRTTIRGRLRNMLEALDLTDAK